VIAYLGLADYLLIAEAVLGVPAESVAHFDRIELAASALAAPQAGFAGVEAYPDLATKAAVLCWHLIKNHPLPDGNKRCAFLATIEFVERKWPCLGAGTW
jgi:death-on-curing protein